MGKIINFLSAVIVLLFLAGFTSAENDKKESTTADASTCQERQASVNRAYDFGARNFYNSYAVQNDLQGAQAQLFLIEAGLEDKPIGSFAENYNAAERFYEQNFSAAKAMGCDTSNYPISPVDAFRRGVKILEEKSK